jgi:hypothetical protein
MANPPCWVFLKAHFDLPRGEHLSVYFRLLGKLSTTNQYLEFATATFIPKPLTDRSRPKFKFCSSSRDLGYIGISDYIPSGGEYVELTVCSQETTSSTLPNSSFLAAPCCGGVLHSRKAKDPKVLKKCWLSLTSSLTSVYSPHRLTW